MIDLLIRARFVVLAATLGALVLLVLFGRDLEYDQSIESFFAADDPTMLAYRDAASSFGNDQFLFVAYPDPDLLTPEGIDRVANLAASIRTAGIEGVVGVESLDRMPLFWVLDDYLLLLEKLPKKKRLLFPGRDEVIDLIKQGLSGEGGGAWETPNLADAIRSAASDPERLDELRETVTAHPLFVGTMINPEGSVTALMVRLESAGEHDAKVTVARIREIADSFGESIGLEEPPAVVGPPVLLADGFIAIEQDGRRLATAGMLLIGLVTLTATRSLWWAIVPLVAGWTVWLGTSTLLTVLELELSLSGGPLVAQIIVLTMPAVSHLALHFRDEERQLGDRRRSSVRTLRSVSVPILWCALTATIGYGALLTSNVVPIRQFGAVLAVATSVAAIMTLALSPSAMMPLLPLALPIRVGGASRTTLAMNRLTGLVTRYPGVIVFGTFAIVAPIALGMPRLVYESNYINAFAESSRVVRDYKRVERDLGGIGLVGVILPDVDPTEPATFGRLRDLDRDLRDIEGEGGQGGVVYATSLATVLDPDDRFDGFEPERLRWLVRTKLGLIEASPQADLLNSFWDRDRGRLRTLVRLSESQPTPAKVALFDRALVASGEHFGVGTSLTGLSDLLTQTTRGVVDTQWTTFTWAAVGILLMLTLAFRGPLLAVLAIMPTLLAVGLVLGLMGWLGLKLDLATALVASVALGLSVDDTFHCLLMYRRRRRSLPFQEALDSSYAVTGPGVLLSSVAVALGFSVLLVSNFVPFATFGVMVAIATAGSSLGNLVLLPACLSLAHRWSRRRTAEPAPQPSR